MLGDYVKNTYVNGGPPGISADRLNNNEDKTAELDTAQAAHLADYATYASVKVGDVYTVVDFKRADTTLYLKSTLSNPDANGYYQTDTIKEYDSAGTTVIKTTVWTLTYDADGYIVTKVVA